MSVVSMKQLLEAGVHFGHQTRRWNPKMAPYIFAERNQIYIIDLSKTVKLINEAYDFVKEVVEEGKPILFVGTKKQAQESIKEEAIRAGEYYVNERWLGAADQLQDHRNPHQTSLRTRKDGRKRDHGTPHQERKSNPSR